MPEATGAAPGPGAMLFPFAMMFLIFYIIVFRPQAKQRKDHAFMLKNLKKHDEVVTSGGLIGTVANVKPDVITLKVGENMRVDVETASITRLRKNRTEAGTEPRKA